MLPLITAVVEHAEPSKTAFYIAAGALVGWALLIGALGVTRETFPQSASVARVVMLVSGVLMLATMASAALTS